jgi:hypothetical protein
LHASLAVRASEPVHQVISLSARMVNPFAITAVLESK